MAGMGMMGPLMDPFHQGPPSPAIPGVNAPVDQHANQPKTSIGQIGQTVGDMAGGMAKEGLAGMLDPAGMMDRQRAARELQGKFDIIGPDHKGEKLPNQVSQEEYDKLVRTYSDIRLGRSDLKIDSGAANDPGQYKADMMDDIGDIMQTASGRQLISQLSNNVMKDASGNDVHRTTTLGPRYDVDPITGVKTPNNTNAGESGNSAAGVGSPFANGKPGVGGDTTIAMNPNMDVSAPGPGGTTNTWRSDVALYHEMVHSLHDTRGTTDTGNVQANDGVGRELKRGNIPGAVGQAISPDKEIKADADAGIRRWEHQAVGLGTYADNPISENAYRKERNGVALSGKGMAGDLLMEQRAQYSPDAKNPVTYNSFFGM